MIQTKLGRKRSLALCTLATGLAVFIFISARAEMVVTASSMLISLTGTAMYAVLCEYHLPLLFPALTPFQTA